MRFTVLLWCCCIACSAQTRAGQPQPTPILKPVIHARYPHSQTAFTQGLQLIADNIYLEGTGAAHRPSWLARVRLDGTILQKVPLPIAGFGEGITQLGDRIYQLTWQSQRAIVYDATTFRVVGEHSYSGEGWGLTHDGKELIMSDGSARIVWRDPKTWQITRTITVSDKGKELTRLNELEYVDGILYANVWLTDRIVKIDPKTGNVLAWIDLSDLVHEVNKHRQSIPIDVANGIAYNAKTKHFFVTGKNWPTLFEVTFKENP